MYRDRRERVAAAAMASDDRPPGCRAERRTEDDIAQEMAIVVQSRRPNVCRNGHRRQRQPIAEMALDDGGCRERGRSVARREGAAFAGRTVAADAVLDRMDERLRDDLRAQQIKSHMRPLVRSR